MDHNNKQVDMEKTMTAEEFLQDFYFEYKGIDFVEDAMRAYARHLIESLSDEVMSYHYIHSNISEGHLIHGAKWARQELLSRIK